MSNKAEDGNSSIVAGLIANLPAQLYFPAFGIAPGYLYLAELLTDSLLPTQLTFNSSCGFFLAGCFRLLLSALLLSGGLAAQETAAFPKARHKELMEEVIFEPEEEEEMEPLNFEPWSIEDINLSQPVIYLIIGSMLLLLGFLIFRILGDVEMRKRTKGSDDEVEAIMIEEIEEEALVASGVSLSLQERAENAGQLDIAVRLLYIQLLKDLQDNSFIKYRKDYSNRDYQTQMAASELLPDFREVTVDYERYWYGKYVIDALSYRLVKRKFATLTSRVKLAGQTVAADA